MLWQSGKKLKEGDQRIAKSEELNSKRKVKLPKSKSSNINHCE